MKPHCSHRRNHALTLTEVLVIIVILFLFFVLIDFGPPTSAKNKAMQIYCLNNLKQIGLAYKIRGGDSEPDLHLQISVTNGGVMELVQSGNAFASYIAMSNEIGSSKILVCPADTERSASTNFPQKLGRHNLSYFVGIDAKDTEPNSFLSGDDNLQIGGTPTHSGLLEFSTNAPIGWTQRHFLKGNIGLADGSVQIVTSNYLHFNLLPQTGLATNHLAIP